MNWAAALSVLAGMAVLVAGAEALVRGASRLGAAAGVSPLIIGLTVVAFGTSAPELAVSVHAAVTGVGDVAIGNAVGSNVFNILAILGVSALFGDLVVHQRLVRVDVPLLLVITAATWLMAADGNIGVINGLVLLLGICAYSVFSYTLGRREPQDVTAEYEAAFGVPPARRRAWPRAVGLVVVGLAALVAGAQWLVTGATALAASLGVPDLIIGLTVVAAGTSLPELATSVVAMRRGERDIAVGNIVGSNIFNLLSVLGAAAVAGGGIPVPAEAVATDIPLTLLVTLVALPALALGLIVTRWEGVLLLVGYAGYVVYLALAGSASPTAPVARLCLFVGLLTMAGVITLVGVVTGRKADGR